MKKIFYIITVVFFLFANLTIAQELTMATDEEIRAAIEKFNIDKSQKEFVFQETKKKLTEETIIEKLNHNKNNGALLYH